MKGRSKYLLFLVLSGVLVLRGDVTGCHCEIDNPVEMAQRACSLCAEAEKQPAYETVFFLKDANPTKPNRILALPRAHGPAEHQLASLSVEIRLELWTAAIARAQELWGDQWGIAYNGVLHRTQCHTHLHIGKLLPNEETPGFQVVSGPSDIPLPLNGGGIWIHPAGGKLHVHLDDDAPELRLQR